MIGWLGNRLPNSGIQCQHAEETSPAVLCTVLSTCVRKNCTKGTSVGKN